MNDGPKLLIILGAALVLSMLFAFLLCAFSATMESSTYNRLTGAQTTWWDALWVELRVQDSPKERQ